MFHHTTRGAGRFSNVKRPFPSGFITGTANRHAAEVNQFEFPFLEVPHFIGMLKALQNHVVHDFAPSIPRNRFTSRCQNKRPRLPPRPSRRRRPPPPPGRPPGRPPRPPRSPPRSGRSPLGLTTCCGAASRLKFGSSPSAKSAPPSTVNAGTPAATASCWTSEPPSGGTTPPPIFARCSFRIALRDKRIRLPSTARTFTST